MLTQQVWESLALSAWLLYTDSASLVLLTLLRNQIGIAMTDGQ